jgi:HSP20 family protein
MNMNLTRMNRKVMSPWTGLSTNLWDVFDRFANDWNIPALTKEEQFMPKIEVKDTGRSYQVRAEVPGMDEKGISLSLKENSLVIEGEKKNESTREDKKKGIFHSEFSYGHFYRSIPLSDDIDSEKVTAHYTNGVLNIEIEKKSESMGRTKKIEIKAGKSDNIQQESKH